MSTARPLESAIRTFRILRVVLDISLLIFLLGMFIQLSFHSDSHQADIHSKQYLTNAMTTNKLHSTKPTAVEFLKEFHDSESSMWSSFFKWHGQSNHAAGSCWFTSPNEQFTDKFLLLCSGENKQPGVPAVTEPMQVFVARATIRPSSTPATTKPTGLDNSDKQQAVVSGWLDTPAGRKHFDPIAKRWKP